VRGQSDEAGFKTVSQPGFEYLSSYVEFWLRFIGVRSVVTLTVEHTWDGRAVDMIDAGKRQAVELASEAILIVAQYLNAKSPRDAWKAKRDSPFRS
jgi:FMN-dependent NADH-azoreductase